MVLTDYQTSNKNGGQYDQQIIQDIMASAIDAAEGRVKFNKPIDVESVFQDIVDNSQTHEYLFWRKYLWLLYQIT